MKGGLKTALMSLEFGSRSSLTWINNRTVRRRYDIMATWHDLPLEIRQHILRCHLTRLIPTQSTSDPQLKSTLSHLTSVSYSFNEDLLPLLRQIDHLLMTMDGDRCQQVSEMQDELDSLVCVGVVDFISAWYIAQFLDCGTKFRQLTEKRDATATQARCIMVDLSGLRRSIEKIERLKGCRKGSSRSPVTN